MIELLRRWLKITHPLDRSSARTCLLLNLGAWPGLGSVLAGRFSGWLQMLLSLGGLLVVIAALFRFMGMLMDETRYPTWQDSFVWMAIGGFAAFVAAWIWSLLTGLAIRSQAVATVKPDPNQPPPL
jgi:hypothetical protein